ncbi:MAG: DUF4126 domain-containing protein [Lentisphaeraceae bacterium]|nr:DUF4126 domain-containing protein [Lentisphaeraceae bacterium]
METILAICVGIGLSAACGFRIFVPLLGLSLAANAGQLELAAGFEWIGSPIAIAAFATATLLEVSAYYIPWLDNLLDSVTTPAAIVAGTILTGSMTGEMTPFLKWAVAIIAGGGTAGAVQTASVLLRGASTATTGGTANAVVSTGELAGATAVTFMAIFIPMLAAFLAAFLICWIIAKIYRKFYPATNEEITLPVK